MRPSGRSSESTAFFQNIERKSDGSVKKFAFHYLLIIANGFDKPIAITGNYHSGSSNYQDN